jgi:hypothetical protein
LNQFFRQQHLGLADEEIGNVHQLGSLALYGFYNVWVAMAHTVHGNARHHIDVFVAPVIPDTTATAPHQGQGQSPEDRQVVTAIQVLVIGGWLFVHYMGC